MVFICTSYSALPILPQPPPHTRPHITPACNKAHRTQFIDNGQGEWYTKPMIALELNKWPPGLIQDLAIGIESTADVLQRYNIAPWQYDVLWANPFFNAELARSKAELLKTGVTFKAKARLLVEHHLTRLSEIIDDAETPPEVVVRAMDKLAEWGGHSAKTQGSTIGEIIGNNVQINFNFSDRSL